jgi:PAS domain S-box-containing protein
MRELSLSGNRKRGSAAMPAQNRKKLLVVGNESHVALEHGKSLEERGYSVLISADGESALAKFADDPSIDLVLMSIELGEGMDGAETAAKMLSERNAPVLFLYGPADREAMGMASGVGSYGFVGEDSSIEVLDASIRTALGLFEAREQLDRIVSESGELIGVLDGEGRYTFVNECCEKALGYGRGELLGKRAAELIHSADLEAALALHEDLKARPRGSADRWRVRDKAGNYLYLECRSRVYSSREGEPMTVVISHDVTERIMAEEALREGEARFRNLLRDVQRIAVQGYSPDGTTQYWNKASELLYGYAEAEALGRNLVELIIPPEMRDEVRRDIRRMTETGEPIPAAELSLMRKDGARVSVYSSHTVVRVPGKAPELFCIDIDLAERKKAEEEIRSLLAEKELLLREAHHRVKNSMGTIASMLSLQARSSSAAGIGAALEEAAMRVQGMMLLYDKLARAEGFSAVSLADYLPQLVDEIAANFASAASVAIGKRVEDFSLDAKRLQLLGIIVNELVTNAMKYAFAGREEGRMLVAAASREGIVSVEVQDDGSGIPESIDFGNSTGLGLMLVEALARQLDGSVRLERGAGTRVLLEFPA